MGMMSKSLLASFSLWVFHSCFSLNGFGPWGSLSSQHLVQLSWQQQNVWHKWQIIFSLRRNRTHSFILEPHSRFIKPVPNIKCPINISHFKITPVVLKNLILTFFLNIYLHISAGFPRLAPVPGSKASSLHWLSGSSFIKHLEAIVCRCQSVSRCIWAGQQHFTPLEQLGGTENECVFPSFVSYKTPRENSHLEPIFLSLLALTCFDGERKSPYASF